MRAEINKVWFDDIRIYVELNDGAVIGAPVSWYPNLRKGIRAQWEKYEIWNEGSWLHWEELDEDLSVEGFWALIKNKVEA